MRRLILVYNLRWKDDKKRGVIFVLAENCDYA